MYAQVDDFVLAAAWTMAAIAAIVAPLTPLDAS